jgi:membrane protein required for colicin V production
VSGLLRSLATIFGYVAAMGIAAAAGPHLTPLVTTHFKLPPAQSWLVFGAILAGFLLSALLRFAVGEMVGPKVSIPDSVAGRRRTHTPEYLPR